MKNARAVSRSPVRQSRESALLDVFTNDLEACIHVLAAAHEQPTLSHRMAAPLRGLIETGVRSWTEPDDRGQAPARHPPHVGKRLDLKGKTALLVEDRLAIALDAQATLRNCGAEVELAATASDAKRAIRLGRFDAAVLDVDVDVETSFPIAEALEERDIPFVFATGHGEAVAVPERFRHIPILSKPYTEDALRDALAT